MKAHGKMYDFDGFTSCIKKAKSEPLEMGINGEDLAFCGLKSNMSHHFIKKLEQRLNVDKKFFLCSASDLRETVRNYNIKFNMTSTATLLNWTSSAQLLSLMRSLVNQPTEACNVPKSMTSSRICNR